jgi:two-component system LytT family sensor kinase
MATPWYKRKWGIVLLHTAVWVLIYMLPFLLQRSVQNTKHEQAATDRNWFIYLTISTDILWIILFYLNAFVLIPKLIYRKKYLFYFLVQLIILSVFVTFHWLFFTFVTEQHQFSLSGFLLFNTFPFAFILACSTAYRMVQDRIEAERLLKERENENLKTELSFLRSQVSPHFMFNVLNNMVSLARKKSDLLEPSLIKLSSLMRYMLYETDEQKVPLQKEVEYLQSYIDLQQQRFGKKLTVKVDIDIHDCCYEIEPMLLIPFIENAFKHGTGMIEEPMISVQLKADDGVLQLTVQNKFNCKTAEIKDKASGIGLTNVKRRLNLLYGKNHSLQVSDKNGWFVTSLQLKLH